jgi:hypothetical protein
MDQYDVFPNIQKKVEFYPIKQNTPECDHRFFAFILTICFDIEGRTFDNNPLNISPSRRTASWKTKRLQKNYEHMIQWKAKGLSLNAKI